MLCNVNEFFCEVFFVRFGILLLNDCLRVFYWLAGRNSVLTGRGISVEWCGYCMDFFGEWL